MYSLSKQQVYSFEDVPFTFQNQHGANVKEGNQDYFFFGCLGFRIFVWVFIKLPSSSCIRLFKAFSKLLYNDNRNLIQQHFIFFTAVDMMPFGELLPALELEVSLGLTAKI